MMTRECPTCGGPVAVKDLLQGSRRALLDSPPDPAICASCGTGLRYRARSTSLWFFGLMVPVVYLGFGPLSAMLEEAAPQLVVPDRQGFGLHPLGFMLIAACFIMPATVLVRLIALRIASLEKVE